MTLTRRDLLRLGAATTLGATTLAVGWPAVPAIAGPPHRRRRRETEPRLHGVLEPDKPPLASLDLAGEYADGLRVRVVGVVWGSYETARGTFSSSYLDTVVQRIDAYRTAGYGDAFQPRPGDAGVNAVFNRAPDHPRPHTRRHRLGDLNPATLLACSRTPHHTRPRRAGKARRPTKVVTRGQTAY